MIDIGVPLERSVLSCHMIGCGEPESGKSKCIECICRQLIKKHQGFLFLDPHGHTFYDLLEWLTYIRPERKIYIIDTTTDKTQGFAVARSESKEPDFLMTSVKKKARAVLRAWGYKDASEVPRLAKWLKCIFWALTECELPLSAFEYFLNYEAKGKREEIIRQISNPEIKRQLNDLCGKEKQAYQSYLESTENRLQIFLHPQIQRVLSQHDIDPKRVMDERAIVLCNFQASPRCDEETNTTAACLLIDAFTQAALERPQGAQRFYLILDEAYRFLTGDIKTIIDETRKYGLSLFAFSQREDQFPRDIASALTGCKVKLTFSTADSPKPQRHFECQIRAHNTRQGVVPEVRRHPMPFESIRKYKAEILSHVDPVPYPAKNEREWNAKDYFRKR